MAFEPQWEARFGPNSYGFRPGRGAIGAIYTSIDKKDKYVLEAADIHKFFDQVNHEALIGKFETFPQMRRQITPWLEAEILDRGEYPE